MARKKILVIGWYNHGNVGDEAFKTAFQTLFPQFDFTFDTRPHDDTNAAFDAVWVGAGSYLDEHVGGLAGITIPMGFIGIGMNYQPGDLLLSKMALAKALVVRDSLTMKALTQAGLSPVLAPDLAFANPVLANNPQPEKVKKAVVLMNDFFMPKMGGESWQTAAWGWFQHEFSRALQGLIDDGYTVSFVPMCQGGIDDRRPAGAVIGYLPTEYQAKTEWVHSPGPNVPPEQVVHNAIAEADLVVTQRYHGMVFAAQMGKPFIAISGHDKVKGLAADMGWGGCMDYYGFSRFTFRGTRRIVSASDPAQLLNYARKAKEQWNALSGTIAAAFGG